ncbi:MAG: beta-Ala-His dipeptidase [Azovibrio sp.]|uniref:beta-Ala-His dipeptidase n=1 Tax=Azovibrio sp. TaxID=1872673 RepID=UPI003C72B7FB
MITDPIFTGLSPQAVWRHFATLCAIPRPSKHEAALRRHLMDWAAARGLDAREDAAGNLILTRPASPGREQAPGIVLQGHLDMVAQKHSDYAHDFFRDPIRPELENGWLLARHTTLGADNGIGVALALAALEDDRLAHGPLEVLLTADEEAGMGGARALEAGTLQGRYLINLDTEEWGQFYLGCAGGVDVLAQLPAPAIPAASGWVGMEVKLDGLTGGHSGVDIHENRANAIRLMLALLLELGLPYRFAVARLTGGSVRNALPRSAQALLLMPALQCSAFRHAVQQISVRLRRQYPNTDPELSLSALPSEALADTVIEPRALRRLALALSEAPYGVAAMSQDFPGVVETSSHLGTLDLAPGRCEAGFLVRSLRDPARDALAEQIAGQIRAAGGTAAIFGAYPGWEPRPDSTLLARCQAVYASLYGQPAGLQVIHAGLECGLIAHSHPQLEMISFGPDIRGAHAPGERVEVASVGRCWQLLTALLDQLALPQRRHS